MSHARFHSFTAINNAGGGSWTVASSKPSFETLFTSSGYVVTAIKDIVVNMSTTDSTFYSLYIPKGAKFYVFGGNLNVYFGYGESHYAYLQFTSTSSYRVLDSGSQPSYGSTYLGCYYIMYK